jgi:hypothetical protein
VRPARSPWTGHPPTWRGRLRRDPITRGILPSAENVIHALRFAPALQGAFEYDPATGRTMLLRPLPGAPADAWNGPRPARDADVSTINRYLHTARFMETAADTIIEAIDTVTGCPCQLAGVPG